MCIIGTSTDWTGRMSTGSIGLQRTIWNNRGVTQAERTDVEVACWLRNRWTRWLHCWCLPTTLQRTRHRTAAGTKERRSAWGSRSHTETRTWSKRRLWTSGSLVSDDYQHCWIADVEQTGWSADRLRCWALETCFAEVWFCYFDHVVMPPWYGVR